VGVLCSWRYRRARATLPVRSVKNDDLSSAWCQCAAMRVQAHPLAGVHVLGRSGGTRASVPQSSTPRAVDAPTTRRRSSGLWSTRRSPSMVSPRHRVCLPDRRTGSDQWMRGMAWIAPHCRYTPLLIMPGHVRSRRNRPKGWVLDGGKESPSG
jgi:hypothetical protein